MSEEARGTGSHGSWGSSGSCGANGWSVWRWESDHYEPEEQNCGAGAVAVPPPAPNPEQAAQMNTYKEFRVIVCCGSSGSGSA